MTKLRILALVGCSLILTATQSEAGLLDLFSSRRSHSNRCYAPRSCPPVKCAPKCSGPVHYSNACSHGHIQKCHAPVKRCCPEHREPAHCRPVAPSCCAPAHHKGHKPKARHGESEQAPPPPADDSGTKAAKKETKAVENALAASQAYADEIEEEAADIKDPDLKKTLATIAQEIRDECANCEKAAAEGLEDSADIVHQISERLKSAKMQLDMVREREGVDEKLKMKLLDIAMDIEDECANCEKAEKQLRQM